MIGSVWIENYDIVEPPFKFISENTGSFTYKSVISIITTKNLERALQYSWYIYIYKISFLLYNHNWMNNNNNITSVIDLFIILMVEILLFILYNVMKLEKELSYLYC